MTTAEVEKHIEKLTKEINKAKGDNTKLKKEVVELAARVADLEQEKK